MVHIGTFAVMAIAFFFLLYTLLNRKYRKWYVPIKMVNSLIFVLTLLLYAGLSGHKEKLFYLLPAFLLCFVGDLAMGLHNKYVKGKYLIAGMVFFLLGHVGFIAYFYTKAGISVVDFILPVVGILLVWVLDKKEVLLLGKYKYPAMIYTLFVGTMASKSFHNAYLIGSSETMLLAIAGALYLVSDSLIGVMYFKKKHGWTAHGFNIATYYLAMYLIAVSVMC